MKTEISPGAYAAFAAAWRALPEVKKQEWLNVLKGDKLTACDRLIIHGAIKKQPTKKVAPQARLKDLKKLKAIRPELFSQQLQSELNALIDTLKPKDKFKPFR